MPVLTNLSPVPCCGSHLRRHKLRSERRTRPSKTCRPAWPQQKQQLLPLSLRLSLDLHQGSSSSQAHPMRQTQVLRDPVL